MESDMYVQEGEWFGLSMIEMPLSLSRLFCDNGGLKVVVKYAKPISD